MPSKDDFLEEQLGLKLRKEDLINKVLSHVKNEDLTHSEAILEVCEEYGIEPEDIATLITGPLKEKLRVEAMRRNILPNRENASDIIQDCT